MKIRLTNGRPIVGEWTVTLDTQRALEFSSPGWHWARFGIFKLKSEPVEGVAIHGQDYTGFIWHWYYWLPVERRW